MNKYFVVSDVHSFFDELMTALDNAGFEKDNLEHILCVCGDLFDRGDGTVALFAFVQDLAEKNRLIYVRGNHEDLLFDCVDEIEKGGRPSQHHFHNGTVKTICQFCEENEWIIYDREYRKTILKTMQPILDFISMHSVDYAEIGDCILVHGWIPEKPNKDVPLWDMSQDLYDSDWRNASEYDWESARWLNGMKEWKRGIREEGKTIICGHWHCSYGWSHIRQEYKEWPPKSGKDWSKSFEPFVDEGIIAIDACTAYSGKINCVVLEVIDE